MSSFSGLRRASYNDMLRSRTYNVTSQLVASLHTLVTMAPPSTPSPASISAEAFAALLGRYPEVIAAVSEAKGTKPGQKSLAELDAFRYKTAPSIFGRPDGRPMVQDDVLTLVSWKLRHGKFRPTLMKLVESNSAAVVQKTVEQAVAAYRSTATTKKGTARLAGRVEAALAAVKILSTLKGIGPATASLLAAVHFPRECIFFSDEAYAWLCGGTTYSGPSKYNAKEYEDVARGMVRLLQRLPGECGAQDVEQVAYVAMYDRKTGAAAAGKLPAPAQGIDTERVTSPAGALLKDVQAARSKTEGKTQGKTQDKTQDKATKKRKEPPVEAPSTGARRSSRLKRS